MLDAMCRMIRLGRGGAPEEAADGSISFAARNRIRSVDRCSSAAAGFWCNARRDAVPFALDDRGTGRLSRPGSAAGSRTPTVVQFGGSGMKAYELQETSGVSGLRLVEKPTPSAGPGEVLVRIRAVTLNYRDILTIKGGYGSRQKRPLIPLSDG